MNPVLDDLLCKKFPHLYQDRHGDIKETCMVFGFECDDGWYQLIHDLSERLEVEILCLPKEEQSLYRAVQVKEKFGELRFYMISATDQMRKLIEEAEAKSITICESCGSLGVLRVSHGWYFTACEKHSNGAPSIGEKII